MKEAVRFVTVHVLDGKSLVDLPFWVWKLSSSIELCLFLAVTALLKSPSFPSYGSKALLWCLNYYPKISTEGSFSFIQTRFCVSQPKRIGCFCQNY